MKVNVHHFNITLLFFYYLKIKLEAQWAEPVSLTFHSALRKLNTEPPIGASHQVLVIWLNSYREEDITNQPIRNKNCLWRPCLLTDRN
jgi:hypothetical protein